MRLPCVYVVVRRNMPAHHQLTQACHAAYLSGAFLPDKEYDHRLVTLMVDDEEALLRVAGNLDVRGVSHRLFWEPDEGAGYTALATSPLRGSDTAALRALPLWRVP